MSAIVSVAVSISYLMIELSFTNSSSLQTSSCDIWATMLSYVAGASTYETDFLGFVIFPND